MCRPVSTGVQRTIVRTRYVYTLHTQQHTVQSRSINTQFWKDNGWLISFKKHGLLQKSNMLRITVNKQINSLRSIIMFGQTNLLLIFFLFFFCWGGGVGFYTLRTKVQVMFLSAHLTLLQDHCKQMQSEPICAHNE